MKQQSLPLDTPLIPELEGAEPRALWSIFLGICAIPHPSLQEGALADAILERVTRKGFSARKDAAGNLIISRPASPGREQAPGIILQAHMDMVPQAAAGVVHDFSKDPIRPRRDPQDPGRLSATGTTLGADDGIGVAAALALLEDPSLECGPMEILLTVNEENGMDGARGLAKGSLKGHYLLNLDGEEEREIGIGSAGANRFKALISAPREALPTGSLAREVSVAGLLGGHSAGDIHRGRGNALIILASILAEGAAAAPGLRLSEFGGGTAANAIPREARALVALPPEEIAAFEAKLQAKAEALAAILAKDDPGLTLQLRPAALPATAVAPAASAQILATLAGLPNGVRTMSRLFPGLVALSSNLGIVQDAESRTGELALDLRVLVRGERDADKEACAAKIRAYLEERGARTELIAVYPAWTPNPDAPLLAAAKEAHRRAYGREPLVMATHGGLECSHFRPAYPEWDMISVGADIRDLHAPTESVDLASVGRYWRFLRELIGSLR